MSNQAGKAYAFMAITPIRKGEEAELRLYLESFTHDTSPFATLPQTHFARWVILPQWVDDRSQPRKDSLDSQYLIFTSNFDSPLAGYLNDLCAQPDVAEIWRHCVGCPQPTTPKSLKAYLLHNQVDIGFFVAAYDDLSVAEVKTRLALREKLIAFAVSSQGLDPPALQAAFNAEFGAA